MLGANLAKGIKGPRELASNSSITPATHPLISVLTDGHINFLDYPDLSSEPLVNLIQLSQSIELGAM